MLPCLHSAGTFVMGTKPGVVFCSVCSIPYYRASSEVERAGDTQEPHSKRQHVEEPRDNLFGPPVGASRPMFPPPAPSMGVVTALPSATADEEKLVAMGFELRDVREALRRVGSVDLAVMALLGEAVPAAAVPPLPAPAPLPPVSNGFRSNLNPPPMRAYARYGRSRNSNSEVEEIFEACNDSADVQNAVEDWKDRLDEQINDIGTLLQNAIHYQRADFVEEIIQASNDDFFNDVELVSCGEHTPLGLACQAALGARVSVDRELAEDIVLLLLDSEDREALADKPVESYLRHNVLARRKLRNKAQRLSREMEAMSKEMLLLQRDNERLRRANDRLTRDLNEQELIIEQQSEVRVVLEDEEEEEEEEEQEEDERVWVAQQEQQVVSAPAEAEPSAPPLPLPAPE